MNLGLKHRVSQGAASTRAEAVPSPLTSFVASIFCVGALVAALVISVGGSHAQAWAAGRSSAGAENDRTLKLDLIDRLKTSPGTLILGSSRGRRAAPTYLQELTGRTGFNAAVTSGTAADAWVMIRYLADCFPHQKRRYLWFVDVGIATNGINPDLKADVRSHKYLGPAGGSSTGDLDGGGRVCGPGDRSTSSPYNPDGSLGPASVRNLPEKAQHLDETAAKLVASVRAHPVAGGGKLDPRRYVYFERALSFMNSRGERPVIVLNPIYPTVLAELEKAGFPARATSRAYLTQLHKRFSFVVVDAQDIRRWGGSPRDFADPTHINDKNMRRLLAYVVAHSDAALR